MPLLLRRGVAASLHGLPRIMRREAARADLHLRCRCAACHRAAPGGVRAKRGHGAKFGDLMSVDQARRRALQQEVDKEVDEFLKAYIARTPEAKGLGATAEVPSLTTRATAPQSFSMWVSSRAVSIALTGLITPPSRSTA